MGEERHVKGATENEERLGKEQARAGQRGPAPAGLTCLQAIYLQAPAPGPGVETLAGLYPDTQKSPPNLYRVHRVVQNYPLSIFT